jgi:hypothetical protein
VVQTMATAEDYVDLRRTIESAGFFTDLRHISGEGYFLVCVSDRNEEGDLFGTSFWVRYSQATGQWYLFTWAPRFYQIPRGQAPDPVCLDCLRDSESCNFSVPDHLVQKWGFVEVPRPSFGEER